MSSWAPKNVKFYLQNQNTRVRRKLLWDGHRTYSEVTGGQLRNLVIFQILWGKKKKMFVPKISHNATFFFFMRGGVKEDHVRLFLLNLHVLISVRH